MATAVRPSLGLSRLLQSSSICSSLNSTAAAPLATSAAARCLPLIQTSSFSASAPLHKRRRYKTRDNNRLRGVSSINRSGPREPLSVSNEPLPRPREKPKADSTEVKDPEHPLWEFFYEPGKQLPEPGDDVKHGRPWTAEELRRKSWDDLHRLWYKCIKELNRIGTARYAREENDIGFGEFEANKRSGVVRKTMSGIRHVLTERYYAWEDAVELAKTDPEVNLSGDGPAYTPKEYLVEETEGYAEEVQDAAPEHTGSATDQKIRDLASGEAAPTEGAERTSPKA